MPQKVRCNLCGADDHKVLYNIPSAGAEEEAANYAITDHSTSIPPRIVKCRKCGLIYANPRPSPVRLVSNYTEMVDHLYLEEEEGRRISARSILKVLKKMGKAGRLLDIGCATGFLLDEARKEGWDVYGIDLSKWAIDYAKNKLGLKNIFQGALVRAKYQDDFFDVVIMKDVIEHLTDPKGTLEEIRRILKPGGIVCVNTPNIASLTSKVLGARWWGVKQAHLYYFTWYYIFWGSLHKMLHQAGFIPLRTKSHVRAFTFKYWVNQFKSYSRIIYRILVFLMEKLRLENRLLRIDLGDQIEVYAAKPGAK
ncbi:MAG: class I SAM-dependent methyltransferase [Candidatus Omnitrophica bacterium]|nr:class I SAM-dependent methyltransferase [Candidatus Omnitrophota bacterium]